MQVERFMELYLLNGHELVSTVTVKVKFLGCESIMNSVSSTGSKQARWWNIPAWTTLFSLLGDYSLSLSAPNLIHCAGGLQTLGLDCGCHHPGVAKPISLEC